MTTVARGVPAPKRAVSAITSAAADAARACSQRAVIAGERPDARAVLSTEAPARRAAGRDHAWVEAAAIASMRFMRA